MNDNKRFLKIIIVSQLIISLIMFIIISFILKDVVYYYNNTLYMLSKSEATKYMKATVNNTIFRIDTKRDRIYTQAKDAINFLEYEFSNIYNNCSLYDLKNIYFKILKTEVGEAVQIEIIDNYTGKIIHTSEKNKMDNLDKELFAKIVKKEKYTVKIYTTQNHLDNIVKKQIYDDIHNSNYQDNQYIWVNEIINYEGGENYAIRKIHPNIISSEGNSLSTNTKDIKGNFPYRKELDGIKQNGEILQTYYFKNKNDNRISEKLSYAKIYKPFNWVIATGAPINDIFKYTNQLNVYNKTKFLKLILTIIFFMAITNGALILIIINVQKKHYEFIDMYIKKETATDLLTGAFSRKWAEYFLNNCIFNNIKPLFIMIDIDNFKNVNDTYGHDVGDIVLKRVTNAIQICLHEEDKLVRWGGEEFLLFCPNIDIENELEFVEKILSTVNSIKFQSDNYIFKVSISMGGAYMTEHSSYTNTIKLSDEALYKSKHTGKNKYCRI